MKVMSFNTQHCFNYIEKKIDFDIMARTILELNADIVGLNEMRNESEHEEYTDQVGKLAELTGMKYHYFAKAIDVEGKHPYGNGFLSKIPIISAETIIIPDPNPKTGTKYYEYYETRCLAKIKLDNGFTVLVSHFGLNADEAENAVKTVTENLEASKCILMGDFNLTPDNPILNPIREKMNDTADVFSEPKMSFPSDNPKIKIDYIFVSRDITVSNADIPAITASDHRPHTAEILID